jgi:hypothetical protein
MKLTETLLKDMIKEELDIDCGNVVAGILGLVKEIDPNDVSDIFSTVFEQLPGVELEMDPGAEEELPTDYQAGGTWEDRPVVGFEEQLKLMISEVLQEDIDINTWVETDPEEVYDWAKTAKKLAMAGIKVPLGMGNIQNLPSKILKLVDAEIENENQEAAQQIIVDYVKKFRAERPSDVGRSVLRKIRTGEDEFIDPY